MDNFNLKKFLTENKLTHTSHLREGFHSPADPNTVAYNKVKSEWDAGNISDRRYTNTKWMDLPDKTQKELYDKYKDDYYEDTMDVDTSGETYDYEMNEDKKEYYKNAEADDAEHIKALDKDMKDDKKSSKMKESQLRSKIKEMVLAEMNLNISDETPESEEDFLAEIENMLNGVDEAKKDKEEVDTEEATDDITVNDTETIDTTTTTEVDPDVKEVQDALTQAQAAAQKLGDPKLTDQIGNTITFFTRAHIVEKGAVAEVDEMEEETLNESSSPMLKRILKSSDLNEDLNMSNTPEIENIISLLQGVDGETMEYILRQVGIEDQMKKQLSGEDDEDEYNDMYHPKGFDI